MTLIYSYNVKQLVLKNLFHVPKLAIVARNSSYFYRKNKELKYYSITSTPCN